MNLPRDAAPTCLIQGFIKAVLVIKATWMKNKKRVLKCLKSFTKRLYCSGECRMRHAADDIEWQCELANTVQSYSDSLRKATFDNGSVFASSLVGVQLGLSVVFVVDLFEL